MTERDVTRFYAPEPLVGERCIPGGIVRFAFDRGVHEIANDLDDHGRAVIGQLIDSALIEPTTDPATPGAEALIELEMFEKAEGADDGLEALKVRELHELAALEHVDVGDAKTKAALLEVIRAARVKGTD